MDSIPCRVIPKYLKDRTQCHSEFLRYGSRVSGAMQRKELHPSLYFSVVAIEKGAFWSPSTILGQLYIYIYIFVYNMEMYISDNMLCRINDKLENNFSKRSYLYIYTCVCVCVCVSFHTCQPIFLYTNGRWKILGLNQIRCDPDPWNVYPMPRISNSSTHSQIIFENSIKKLFLKNNHLFLGWAEDFQHLL